MPGERPGTSRRERKGYLGKAKSLECGTEGVAEMRPSAKVKCAAFI